MAISLALTCCHHGVRQHTADPSPAAAPAAAASPREQTDVTLTTTAGHPLEDGAAYGVGIVVVADFSRPVADRAAAQRRLTVTTSPRVAGAWDWVDDHTAHWRPQRYYAPNTTVLVDARISGVDLGGGNYGRADAVASFRIGASHVSVADDRTHMIAVSKNGKLVRTIPTSMGMRGSETVNGRTIVFRTPPGVYTVLDKADPIVMDSSTFGLPVHSRLGYRRTVRWATRLSEDGIFVHENDASGWAQGHSNVTHGCLNVNQDNGKWFYAFSVPGDVVEVRHTEGPPLTVRNNGDWTVPWKTWLAGSAQ
ncbi:MAG: L,D-transpeptidase [Mycobacteriaceae bacterium]|nr:L,D-transpeptidase [Mycobacteriaceae bacterium]